MTHIKFSQTEFFHSASQLNQCPQDTLAEVAFAGRSNAGKSSAINALTRQPNLARTSKTPGRTQLLNFFTLNIEGLMLVDLPGYGYARVPGKIQRQWQIHLNNYLEQRRQLQGLVLVMDIRHPLKAFDMAMVDWSLACDLPLHLLLSKADKLNNNARINTLRQVEQALPEGSADLISVQMFSAPHKEGLDTLERKLVQWLKQPMQDSIQAELPNTSAQ